MNENNHPENEDVKESTLTDAQQDRIDFVNERKKLWSGLTVKDIENRLSRLDFIIDPWGTLDEYSDLVLPEGWSLETTSVRSSLPGTVLLTSPDHKSKIRVKRVIKQFVVNHGLSLAQADTFNETLYFAKFAVLPLLTTVLNDDTLYRAYRTYDRKASRDAFLKWINKYDLQHNDFNIHLTPTNRMRISEMLDRMACADKKLKPYREKMRKKFADRKPA